jgi:hypothetical protein
MKLRKPDRENIPCWEKPWMSAPITMMIEPHMIEDRLPNFWLYHGAIGTPMIEPSW